MQWNLRGGAAHSGTAPPRSGRSASEPEAQSLLNTLQQHHFDISRVDESPSVMHLYASEGSCQHGVLAHAVPAQACSDKGSSTTCRLRRLFSDFWLPRICRRCAPQRCRQQPGQRHLLLHRIRCCRLGRCLIFDCTGQTVVNSAAGIRRDNSPACKLAACSTCHIQTAQMPMKLQGAVKTQHAVINNRQYLPAAAAQPRCTCRLRF